MKEKKNRPFNIRLEHELSATVKKLSVQARLPMGEIIRLCLDRELAQPDYLKSLKWKKKAQQFNLNLVDSQLKKLTELSRQTGVSQAELVRVCLLRQFKRIQREGGLKLKLDPSSK